MSNSLSRMLPLLICTFFGADLFAAEAGKSSYDMSGHMELDSNIVELGLTQTLRNPGLNSKFSLNLGPQVEFGIAGANRKYPDSETNFLLRPILTVKIDFSPRSQGEIAAVQNFYFQPEGRDGTDVKFTLTVSGYQIYLQSVGNWEGSQSAATYIAFAKITNLGADLDWINRFGYVVLKTDNYSSYAEISSDLKYFINERFYSSVEITGTSNAAQFNGAGEFFILAKLGTFF